MKKLEETEMEAENRSKFEDMYEVLFGFHEEMTRKPIRKTLLLRN